MIHARNVTLTLGGSGNTVTGGDGNDTVTGAPGGKTKVTLGNGNDTVDIGGSRDTITLGNGTNLVTDLGGMAFITTGSGDDTITIGGGGNTVNAGGGTNWITDEGSSRDTFVLPGAGDGMDTIIGFALSAHDVLNVHAALAETTWNGSKSTLGNYLKVTNYGSGDTFVSIAANGTGTGTEIAALTGAGNLTLAGLLSAHALLT